MVDNWCDALLNDQIDDGMPMDLVDAYWGQPVDTQEFVEYYVPYEVCTYRTADGDYRLGYLQERGCFPANVQCRGRPKPVILLLDLAGKCLRKLGYEVDVIGNLVPGDLSAYVLDDLVRRRRGPGPSTTKALGRSPIFRYLKIPRCDLD